jgi:hypothetical protein
MSYFHAANAASAGKTQESLTLCYYNSSPKVTLFRQELEVVSATENGKGRYYNKLRKHRLSEGSVEAIRKIV